MKRFFILGSLLLSLGCFDSSKSPKLLQQPGVDASAAPTPLKVKADGALQLGELQQPSVSPEMLLAKVNEHAAAGRRETARRLIARFPDVAEELLRGCDAAKAADPAVQFIAQCQDSIAQDRAWQTWLQDVSGAGKQYAVARAEAVANLKQGKHDPVAKASFSPPAGIGNIDANRLLGQALLLSEKPKEAAAMFEAAGNAAGQNFHQSAQCFLLQGEALRRAGKLPEGKAYWTRGVNDAAALMDRQEPVFDPGLWERASYLKPVDANWPEAAVQGWKKLASQRIVPAASAGGSVPEMWLWAASGQARMDRGEYHSALAAFKRGETMTTDANVRAALAVAQARVLLFLNQPKPATAMLAAVAERKDSPYAPSALAILGAMKLADGAADQALALLKRAVEGAAADVPGRAEAEGDLALAYLSVNDEANGLRWLASAQDRFAKAGEVELLARSKANEARYWESRGRAAEQRAAEEFARRIEGDATAMRR
ncbi:MAG: hypothetical protein U0791_03625 [Gemmataceae bacterium]